MRKSRTKGKLFIDRIKIAAPYTELVTQRIFEQENTMPPKTAIRFNLSVPKFKLQLHPVEAHGVRVRLKLVPTAQIRLLRRRPLYPTTFETR